jgi:cell division protein FtsX
MMAASAATRRWLPEPVRARLPQYTPALLSRQDAGLRPMPLLIAVLVYFGLLALVAVVMVDRLAGSWRDDLQNGLTLMLPADTDPAQVQDLVTELTARLGVAAAEPLSADAVRAELQPWLGGGTLPPDVALPVVVAIELGDTAAAPTPDVLQAHIASRLPAAKLVDNRLWLDDAGQLATVAQLLALGGVLLIGGCLALVVFAVTRLLFAMNSPDVRILHLAGATDVYISRQFERLVLRVTGSGVTLGVLLTAGTLWLMQAGMAGMASAQLFSSVALGWPEGIVLVLTPALLLWGARSLSRRTIARSLQEMPS